MGRDAEEYGAAVAEGIYKGGRLTDFRLLVLVGQLRPGILLR